MAQEIEGANNNPNQELPLTPEFTNPLKEIDRSITARHVLAKFRGNIFLHGQQLLKEGSYPLEGRGYIRTPEFKREEMDPTGQFAALNEMIRLGMYNGASAKREERALASSHVAAYSVDRQNPDVATLQLIYPYQFYDTSGRPALTAQVFFRLPARSLYRLLEIIRENPDALEDFYQIATAGLDPSVPRYQSFQVALVDLNTLLPINQNQEKPGYNTNDPSGYKINPVGIQILEYQSPHGLVNKEEEESKKKVFREQVGQASTHLEVVPDKSARADAPLPTPKSAVDNPSGGDLNAPLTHVINKIIRFFKPRSNS